MTTEKEELKSVMVTTVSQATHCKEHWDTAPGNPSGSAGEEEAGTEVGWWQPAGPEPPWAFFRFPTTCCGPG